MRIIYNKVIPFKGFCAISLFGIIFVREEYRSYFQMNDLARRIMCNHERIHLFQQKELLYVFFFLIYFFEWLVKLIIYGKYAYENISFEREAYKYESKSDYLENRKPFAMWRK